ncbi:anthrone oxygenase family protein [Streptomyces sp. NPDC001568]|uniref:anthrone oxygenase family protein n=1 Tax=Streptomyces sp. NPDC001568 TaxID=3364588 RepID=UPI003695E013
MNPDRAVPGQDPHGRATGEPAAGGGARAAGGGARAAGMLLGVATVLVGLMAGLFFAFDVSVMPGLARLDDAAYVAAMDRFNAAIDGNGLFGSAFVLALLTTAAAALVSLRTGHRTIALWAGAAAVAYLAVLVITFAVNIPLNGELADATGAARSAAPVVEKFKGTWVTTNILRTLLSTLALVALVRALLLHGRATAR